MRSIVKRLHNLSPNTIFLIGFFVFLTFGLFLGDGKQALIDTYATGGILALYVYAKSYCKKYRDVPQNIVILWGAVLLYFVVRTIFSDSVSYSITATIRMIMGYIIFTLFYENATDKFPQQIVHGLVGFSTVAILASFFYLLFPHFTSMLSLMNLLYAYYGHNYLSTILILVYPIALHFFLDLSQITRHSISKKMIFSVFYYLLVIISLFLTFSRGAELLIGLYTIFQIGLLHPKKFSKKYTVILGIALACIGSVVVFSSITVFVPNNTKFINTQITNELIKPVLVQDGRLRYWEQAIQTFTKNPLFGTGPGTFYLDSKRFEDSPNKYSWFSHNILLEWLAEEGLVGTILSTVLIGALILQFLKHTAKIANAKKILSTSLILILLSSFYDFSLSFLLIWLLFFAILGIPDTDTTDSKKVLQIGQSRLLKLTTLPAICIITAYYLLAMIVIIQPANSVKTSAIFITAVANKSKMLANIANMSQLSQIQIRIINYFYNKDSEILFSAAKKIPSTNNMKLSFLKTAVTYDSFSTEYRNALITAYLDNDPQNALVTLMDDPLLKKRLLLESPFFRTLKLSPDSKKILRKIPLADSWHRNFFVSELLYILTLDNRENANATLLLTAAKNLSPEWSFLYLELASLLKAQHNKDAANKIIQECLLRKDPQNDCREQQYNIPQFGSLREDVLAIQ